MELRLEGKRAAVAAASGGLGFAIASALGAEGCRLAVCSRDAGRIDEAAARIADSTGAEVTAAVCDVAEPGRTTAWIDAAASAMGGLDLVVANAGGPPPGRIGDVGPEEWDAAYRLTLRSALEIAAAARPHLSAGAAVLFMTSLSNRQPIPILAMSTVFRPGVAALAKLLAEEWASDGIRVNHLVPGRIATDRLIQIDRSAAERAGTTPEEVRSGVEAGIPLGRYGEPSEYAAAAVFLLSEAASFITGATLVVDGGMLRAIG
jgi:3-oxoacyl-[acyl-carrier protein] reductase